MGNLHSVYKKLSGLDCHVSISEKPSDLVTADKIIMPGVGHFTRAMDKLKNLNYLDVLNEQVLIKEKPILGICLGMQLMCKQSEEGKSQGLSWLNADVKRFNFNDSLRHKVPHTGWNSVEILKTHPILKGIENLAEFYFVHAYHVLANNESDILCKTVYETEFVSAISKEHIIGMQFHPEKSHYVGQKIFKNFLSL
jgi:glutamine amidotransferase